MFVHIQYFKQMMVFFYVLNLILFLGAGAGWPGLGGRGWAAGLFSFLILFLILFWGAGAGLPEGKALRASLDGPGADGKSHAGAEQVVADVFGAGRVGCERLDG